MYFQLQEINPSVHTICMYAEFLSRSFKSYHAIANYISGERLLHKYLGVHASSLYSFNLQLILLISDHYISKYVLYQSLWITGLWYDYLLQ